MSCTWIALLCLDLSGLYIDGSLAALDAGVEQYTRETTLTLIERVGLVERGSTTQTDFRRDAFNPYGRAAIGYEQTFFRQELKLYAEAWHRSSLATGKDRGENGASIGLRWYPWGGAR
ncbi:MAG TPA: hypothetical protein VGD45_20410 [Steroidobacter sp.]|uniref:hypothetical protein n=1 Tax=Steroidobacter sp. TaxID=1978227 RepID=UPI002EDB07B2